MKFVISMCVLLAALGAAPAARAQSGPAVANYAAGWNMVGVPSGTGLSAAAYIYAYSGSGYVSPTAPSGGCQGYWAYFASPTTLALGSATAVSTESCSVQSGWNLLGNPFSGVAALPPGITGYWWDPDANQYKVVQAIPAGASVWVDSSSPGTVSLNFVPSNTAPSASLVISDLSSPGPYRLHVGDTVELLLPSAVGFIATSSNDNLSLESAGFSGPLSCLGDPSCALSLANQFWIWRATAPGTTFISVRPACTPANPNCTGGQRIEIDIQP